MQLVRIHISEAIFEFFHQFFSNACHDIFSKSNQPLFCHWIGAPESVLKVLIRFNWGRLKNLEIEKTTDIKPNLYHFATDFLVGLSTQICTDSDHIVKNLI